MITMGKVDISDLIMLIKCAIDISFQSPKLKWASGTHTTPDILDVLLASKHYCGSTRFIFSISNT